MRTVWHTLAVADLEKRIYHGVGYFRCAAIIHVPPLRRSLLLQFFSFQDAEQMGLSFSAMMRSNNCVVPDDASTVHNAYREAASGACELSSYVMSEPMIKSKGPCRARMVSACNTDPKAHSSIAVEAECFSQFSNTSLQALKQ